MIEYILGFLLMFMCFDLALLFLSLAKLLKEREELKTDEKEKS